MPKTQKVKQEIVIVIDKSGSMASCRDDVIGGFNTYVSDLKKETSVDAKLTLVMFDDNVHKLYAGRKISDVGELCSRTYSPNGSTALNDAVMVAIEDIESRISKSKAKVAPQVIVIVFTDGDENASKTHKDKSLVSAKRAEKEKEGWAFIFMGADMDAWTAGHSYGMSAGNTMGFGKSDVFASTSFLRNRTAKAARLYASNLEGELDEQGYSTAMNNLMTIDEQDLATDQEAVTLRATLDASTKDLKGKPQNLVTVDDKAAVSGWNPADVKDYWGASSLKFEEVYDSIAGTWIVPCCERDYDKDGNCDIHKEKK